jgi:hypothetical protein
LNKMKTNWLKITAAVAAIVSLTGIAQAVPITGNIGFTGTAQLDTDNVNSATKVLGWVNTVVGPGPSGSFAGLGNTAATFSAPWVFGPSGSVVNPFWTVAGFQFNLSSSTVVIDQLGFLNIDIFGTVVSTLVGSGLTPTAFAGTFTVHNPNSGTAQNFTAALSFAPVPDNGTTVILLGLGLLSLGLFRTKLFA